MTEGPSQQAYRLLLEPKLPEALEAVRVLSDHQIREAARAARQLEGMCDRVVNERRQREDLRRTRRR